MISIAWTRWEVPDAARRHRLLWFPRTRAGVIEGPRQRSARDPWLRRRSPGDFGQLRRSAGRGHGGRNLLESAGSQSCLRERRSAQHRCRGRQRPCWSTGPDRPGIRSIVRGTQQHQAQCGSDRWSPDRLRLQHRPGGESDREDPTAIWGGQGHGSAAGLVGSKPSRVHQRHSSRLRCRRQSDQQGRPASSTTTTETAWSGCPGSPLVR